MYLRHLVNTKTNAGDYNKTSRFWRIPTEKDPEDNTVTEFKIDWKDDFDISGIPLSFGELIRVLKCTQDKLIDARIKVMDHNMINMPYIELGDEVRFSEDFGQRIIVHSDELRNFFTVIYSKDFEIKLAYYNTWENECVSVLIHDRRDSNDKKFNRMINFRLELSS